MNRIKQTQAPKPLSPSSWDQLSKMRRRTYADDYDSAYPEDEDDSEKLLEEKEKFEKFAEILMEELVNHGHEDFLILKNPELGKWWAQARKKLAEKRRKRDAVEKLRNALSKDELEALGLTHTLTSIEKEL